MIPLILNNAYVIYSNATQVRAINDKNQIVNSEKVYLSIIWYVGSMLGYYFMELHHQGLDLRSSKEMFIFAVCEASFMISMGMSYFYSW